MWARKIQNTSILTLGLASFAGWGEAATGLHLYKQYLVTGRKQEPITPSVQLPY